MAKEPAGTPDSGEAEPNPDELKSTPEDPPGSSEEGTARQGELPLDDTDGIGPEDCSDNIGDAEKSELQEEGEPEVQGHDEHHGDEYSDDHYGYHDDQYHDDHYGYHKEHQDHPHDDSHGTGAGYGGYDGLDEDEEGEEEEYGGPIKPFLDHLEDFRWMLIKIFAAVLVGMVVALAGAKWVVAFLTYPLEVAQENRQFSQRMENRFVPVTLADKQVTTVKGPSLSELFPIKTPLLSGLFTPSSLCLQPATQLVETTPRFF